MCLWACAEDVLMSFFPLKLVLKINEKFAYSHESDIICNIFKQTIETMQCMFQLLRLLFLLCRFFLKWINIPFTSFKSLTFCFYFFRKNCRLKFGFTKYLNQQLVVNLKSKIVCSNSVLSKGWKPIQYVYKHKFWENI